MQTVPNWQAIAQNYYFAQHPTVDALRQMHLNRNSTHAEVHFQREGVVSYYNAVLARFNRMAAARELKATNALIQIKARKMAEAQFGQFLIGIV